MHIKYSIFSWKVLETLRGLFKRRGFSLCASYAGVRGEPQARGGCHLPDYVGDAKFPTILVPDVGGSDPIAVPDEATALVRATEQAPAR